jgi:hypothetical protein
MRINMKKGDIVRANDRENHFHPIVFLENIDEVRFRACILSSKSVSGNLLMQSSHFENEDNMGNPYKFPSKNTYLITSDSFIKMDYWIDNDNIIGRLTDEGISFVERNIPEQPILCVAPIWKLRPPQVH